MQSAAKEGREKGRKDCYKKWVPLLGAAAVKSRRANACEKKQTGAKEERRSSD